MLILAKINASAAGGYADYLEGKAQASELGDYYLKDGERVEAPGRWARGAEQFALDPALAVTAEQLHTLMDVRRPDTGAALRRAGGTGQAVSAIDATFSVPKSVSAVWALSDPELQAAVEQAHEAAVDRALDYAVAQVPMLRRRVGQETVVHEKAQGVIATSWRHTTARAVDEQVPDPQLHSHVLLHAGVRKDGEVVAIDSRAWLVHQREVGAAYRSHLAHELHELGFDIERGTGRGGRYFEIASVPQPLLDRWSSRHAQVQTAIRQRLANQERELTAAVSAGGPQAADAASQLKALRESGQLSPKQERMMGTVTRSAKTPVTVQDLERDWQRTALAHGFAREQIEVLRRGNQQLLQPATPNAVLDALTEFDATFPARDARAVALEQSAGIPIDDALQALVVLRKHEQILVLADGTGTTRAQRGKERTVVGIVERLSRERLIPLPDGLAATEAQRLDDELATRGGRLSDEQRAAILLACGDRPFVVIEGQAGTGKSTALTGIARAHQAAGRNIVISSTAALAAERLAGDLREAGVDCHAYSTVALNAAIHNGQVTLGPDSTVIHDEAALASTDEQVAVLGAIDRSRSRLIAVGDPGQNQPVGSGGLWNNIETTAREADVHVELTVNQRAQDPLDRRDQARFRNAEAERAIRGYAAREHVHFDNEQRRVEDRALDAAQKDRGAGRDALVVIQTSNERLDQLNARAQAIRLQAGELGADSVPVAGRPYELHDGDEVQVRRTLRIEGQEPLRNGTSATIGAVDPGEQTVELELAGGDTVTLDRGDIADSDLRLAYVQHPFPSQGHTVDTTHLIVGDHSTQEGTYVGLTRARQRTDIYSPELGELEPEQDRLRDLADRLSRNEPEIASIAVPLAQEDRLERANAEEPELGTEVNGVFRALEAEIADTRDRPAEVSQAPLDRAAESDRRWPGRPEKSAKRTITLDQLGPGQKPDDAAVSRRNRGTGWEI